MLRCLSGGRSKDQESMIREGLQCREYRAKLKKFLKEKGSFVGELQGNLAVSLNSKPLIHSALICIAPS